MACDKPGPQYNAQAERPDYGRHVALKQKAARRAGHCLGVVTGRRGVFIRTLYNLQRVNLGFNHENLLVFRLQPEQAGYKDERLSRLYQQLFDRLDHLTGVRAATFASVELIADENSMTDFLLPGETASTAAQHETMRQIVRENYFATMEIAILGGRPFTPTDNKHAPAVAIINQTFAREFFPNQDILGQPVITFHDDRALEIVGIVADTKYRSQREDLQPLLYTPWQQEIPHIGEMHFALRTTTDPATGPRRYVKSCATSTIIYPSPKSERSQLGQKLHLDQNDSMRVCLASSAQSPSCWRALDSVAYWHIPSANAPGRSVFGWHSARK